MKVIQIKNYGVASEVARCADMADPGRPGAGEVLAEVEAFPINPVDLITIAGEYAVKPELPAIPGSEAVGRVLEVGSGVDHVSPGDRIIMLGRANWVSRNLIPAVEAVPVRVNADPLQLAMLKINPPTALLMLERYADLKPGDWVIQNAANSAVGINLIKLARAKGLKTCNVVRREELAPQLTTAGADTVVVDDGECDLVARVAAATGEAGIPLGIDAVAGGGTFRLAKCLDEGGVVVNYGLLSHQPCSLDPFDTVFRRITLTGFWLIHHLGAMTGDEKTALYEDLARRVASGELGVPVDATYPIDEIGAALAHAERDGRNGKILVLPNGPLTT